MFKHTLLILLAITVLGCSGGSTAAGRYHIEQDNNAFGDGAEKIELEMKDDKSYAVTAGKMTMFSGTWTEADKKVTWTAGSGIADMPVAYRVEGAKLIPSKDGKDISFWRWVKK